MSVEVNWIAILLAALSTMVVGSLWYGTLFGKSWEKLAKIKRDPDFNGKKMAIMYTGTFLVSLVTAVVLAVFIPLTNNFFDGNYIVNALWVGLILWAGLTAARMYTHNSFEQRPLQLTVLGVAYELVTIEVIALILAAMPH